MATATETGAAATPKIPRARRAGHDVSGEKRDAEGRFAKGSAKPRAAKTTHRTGNGEGNSTGTLWSVAAAGVAVGVAAMIGRKAVVQAPTALAGDWDAALAAEHAAALKVFDTLQATTTKNTTRRAMLLANLKHMLAKHAMQEENVVYPALRDAGETEVADHLNSDHGYVKQYLYELTNCPKDSARFLDILARFRVDLEKHMREEEDAIFPSLKAKLAPEKTHMLTVAMNKEGFKLA